MRKGKRPTTLVDIRTLLLRIAVMVSLVGLGGVLVKPGAVAKTTSSRVLTPAETQRSYGAGEHLNYSYVIDRQLPSGRPAVAVGGNAFSANQGSEVSAHSHPYRSLVLQHLRHLFG